MGENNSDERSPLLGPRIASLRQSEVSMVTIKVANSCKQTVKGVSEEQCFAEDKT